MRTAASPMVRRPQAPGSAAAMARRSSSPPRLRRSTPASATTIIAISAATPPSGSAARPPRRGTPYPCQLWRRLQGADALPALRLRSALRRSSPRPRKATRPARSSAWARRSLSAAWFQPRHGQPDRLRPRHLHLWQIARARASGVELQCSRGPRSV